MLRPARRLPRQFRRPVSPRLRSFAQKRHGARGRNWAQYARTRWRRFVLSSQSVIAWLRRYALALASACVVLAMAIVLFSPLLTVREIELVRQYGRLDAEAVQQQVKDLYGRRLLLVSANMVRERIVDTVPDMQDVSIEKHYPSRLVIRVELQPFVARVNISNSGTTVPPPKAANATGATIVVRSASGSVVPLPPVRPSNLTDFLTDQGLYIQAIDVQSGALLPEIRIEDWSVRPQPGTLLFQPTLFKSMQEAEAILNREFGQATKYRTMYIRGQEFHLSNGRVSLWFDGRISISSQIERYRLFLKAVGLKNVQRYIDLRLSGKVVYK